MKKNETIVVSLSLALSLLTAIMAGAGQSRWGRDYFPNHELTTHDGKVVRFFDDLVEDKVVVINFIYTTCPDVCPLETAQLTRVQRILGDRLGRDVFFYSISIDPDHDTPEVLRDYRQRFGAEWPFLTGDKDEIIDIRRKLGLYVEDLGGGENNHNVNMIIGNQSTGRWMKRSPFENPYVLADQIGNWLTGWKAPQEVKDYANAPELRNLSQGEILYRTRCLSCHSIDGSKDQAIGPDLLAVHQRRDRTWLMQWLKAPDEMLAAGDPLATRLFEQFNRIPMPNLGLTQVDIMDLLDFIQEETASVHEASGMLVKSHKTVESQPSSGEPVVEVLDAWVRQALPGVTINAGYMTLVNLTHADISLVHLTSTTYGSIEIHKMSPTEGMVELEELIVPSRNLVKLEPGGLHLMLLEPLRDHIRGIDVELELTFADGRRQVVFAEVR